MQTRPVIQRSFIQRFYCVAIAVPAVAASGAAHAQCNNSGSPQPTPTQNVTYSNGEFTNPYVVANPGEGGCNGANRGTDRDGNPGAPGQASGGINNTATNIIVTGSDVNNPWAGAVYAIGGNGGNGGNAGSPVFVSDVFGGNGGGGGGGGPVAVTFSGTVSTGSGPNQIPATGFLIESVGGQGGAGGSTGTCCAGNRHGGDGGIGGTAATALLTGSGQIRGRNWAVIVQSIGGNGGAGGSVRTSDVFTVTYGGQGANGGNGGDAVFNWQSGDITAGNQGVTSYSEGGAGGEGGSARDGNTNYGGNGGAGGNGGNASITMAGGSVALTELFYSAYNAGLIALSEGGTGGAGGRSGGLNGAEAGNGGNGGTAGAASASVTGGTIDFTGLGQGPGRGIFVLSAGGKGGAGGNASAAQGSSGGGGLAGAAGAAALTVGSATAGPTVTASGKYASTAVVQSIGGGGGNGGAASFFQDSGAGAPGGDGGSASATIANGILVTQGASASGLIAQSIGGGGGVGGDATGIEIGAAVSIGGNGGLGGNGNGVTVQIGENAIIGSLDVLGDSGVLAQSIGGSGGAGGSAVAKGSGFIAMTIGGDAGGGGQAGAVDIASDGLITSYGDHAAGLQAQSVGGGGGKGGAAVSFGVGVVPSTSIAIGGRGGNGGPAGTATAGSTGQVTTFGHNAYGIVAQSVGGGGGSGGASAARVVSISPSESFPAISVSVALGGAGGSGNTGATATATNSGLVTTAGESAYALVAQSVGGGGGIGGDATAASYSGGNSPGLTVSFALAVGGSGGTGATGGAASVDNSGLLLTYGNDAYGVFAQSVGGGGGAGGTGDASATASKAQASFSASLAIGGTGGTGGHGGAVNGTSSGGIATNGDGADGMFVQSVGGGGGAGGGGIGAANGGNLTISVGLGGSGGAGGDGGTVTAANSGAIVTRGTDAVGLLAQSVGGGGGKGGKAGATSGGVNPVANAKNLTTTLEGGLNLGASVTQPIAGIFAIGKIANEVYSAANELYGIAQQAAGGPFQVGNAVKIGVGISVGGKGGAAGNGGDVTATNTGEISNFGAQSDAIFAQSIGGGGGKGGAATSTDTATNDSKTQVAIGGGGAGGAGGDGGDVSVINEKGALADTKGVLGFGIFAQSVGGGGGTGGLAGTVSGSLVSLSVGISGDGGSQGTGGNVQVSNAGTVSTSAKHGIGIFAQSIGGGGGLFRSMTTNETFDPADIANNPQGRLGDIHGVTLSFNGSTNTTGDAGTAEVDVSGQVTTTGRTAHAILAQSIGGGGGAAIGGLVLSGDTKTGTGNGNGDTVTITTSNGAVISTAGDGAYGILAQSIGGGGGLGGSFADVSGVAALAGATNVIKAGTGSAGDVNISLTGTRLTTTGKLAPAIYAQSLGGGGGLIGQGTNLLSGGAGGSGSGDNVGVTLVNTTISATGIQSPGIVIQTNGSGGAIVSIDANSSVTGGAINEPAQTTMAGAIYIQQGVGNTITNAGTITGAGNLNPTAILSDAAVKLVNTGTISGAVVTGGNGSVLENRAGAVFDPGSTIALGSGGRLANAGTLVIGRAGIVGKTQLTGDLVSTGGILFDADFAGGKGDTLVVSGRADLASELTVTPQTMRNTRLPLVSAAGGLSITPGVIARPAANQLFDYRLDNDATTLYVTPQARFAEQANGLGSPEQAVAGHLQSLFDSGAAFDAGFTTLSNLASPQAYASTLSSVSRNALGAMGALRYQSSRRFTSDVIDACDTARDTDCIWARGLAGRTTQDEAADALGYQADFQVFEMGGQLRIGEGLYLAGALAYEHSTLNDSSDTLGDTARISGDSLFAAIGLHYRAGAFEIVGSLDGGYGWYNSQRQISAGGTSQIATADPRLWNIGLALAASYRQPLGTNGYLKPFAALRGSNVESGAFAEQSASPFALDVLAQSDFAVSGTVGAALGTRIAAGGSTRIEPFLIAAIEFASDTDWTTSARFVGESGTSDPFTVQTRAPGTFGRFAIGAEIASGAHFALTLSYNPEFGSDYTTQQGVARLTYRF